MKKAVVVFGLSIALSVLLIGCGQEPASTPDQAERAADEPAPLKLALVSNSTSDFWTFARRGVEDAVKELGGIQYDFKMPADGSTATQKQIIDDLLVRGFDGIAVSPVDPINEAAYLSEVAKQTLLITQDSDSPDSGRAFYIGSDNVAAGRMAGELIREALPDGGQIMLFVGRKDAQNAMERIQGIEESLKDTKIEILGVRTDDTDRARAKGNVSDALVANPEIDCLVGLWSYNGPAIYNAVKESGNTTVKIVTFDEEEETLAGVVEGRIYGTVVQQPYQFGYQSMMAMAKVLRKQPYEIPENKVVTIPTRKITKDNVTEFKTEMDRLRGRAQ